MRSTSRETIPSLMAEIQRLQQANRELQEKLHDNSREWQGIIPHVVVYRREHCHATS